MRFPSLARLRARLCTVRRGANVEQTQPKRNVDNQRGNGYFAPRLRLSAYGDVFAPRGLRASSTLDRLRKSGPAASQAMAMAMAMAMSRAMAMSQAMAMNQAMAMTQGATVPFGAAAQDGETVARFGGSVLGTWAEVRELSDAGLAYLAEQSSAHVGSDTPEADGPPIDYRRIPAYEKLDIGPPPGFDHTYTEIKALHAKQRRLRCDDLRQVEVRRQMTANDPVDMLRPLGIEELSGFSATRDLITTVLQITERVGYYYKIKFARPRPSMVDPTLRTFIPNPPHPSYPSNHAFQSFSVAHMLTRTIPELTATTDLFHVALRIGENREYAGLHYRSDTEAGERLAAAFAPYLFYTCRYKMRAAQREWY